MFLPQLNFQKHNKENNETLDHCFVRQWHIVSHKNIFQREKRERERGGAYHPDG